MTDTVTVCADCPWASVSDRITCTAPNRQGCRLIHPEASDIDLRTEADFDAKTDDHADNQEVRHV